MYARTFLTVGAFKCFLHRLKLREACTRLYMCACSFVRKYETYANAQLDPKIRMENISLIICIL